VQESDWLNWGTHNPETNKLAAGRHSKVQLRAGSSPDGADMMRRVMPFQRAIDKRLDASSLTKLRRSVPRSFGSIFRLRLSTTTNSATRIASTFDRQATGPGARDPTVRAGTQGICNCRCFPRRPRHPRRGSRRRRPARTPPPPPPPPPGREASGGAPRSEGDVGPDPLGNSPPGTQGPHV